VYKSQGQYEKALEKYTESLRIRESIYGHDHPDVADSLNNIRICRNRISQCNCS